MSTATTTRFSPYDVPATANGMNRFPAGRTMGGHLATPDEAYAQVLSALLADRVNDAPTIIPERVEVRLFKPVRDEKGEYRLVPRPSVSGVPTREPVRPGVFSKLEHEGVELLNDFFLGGESYAKATDAQVWDAMLAACIDVQAQGRSLRRIADRVSQAILLRAGIVARDDFPWE